MSTIELHGFMKCPFAFRSRITAREKGVSFDWLPVDAPNPDPRALAHNPARRSPLMIHDDFVLIDSAVILHYLDEAFEGPALQPAEPRARARMRLARLELSGLLFDGRKAFTDETRAPVEAALRKLDEKLAEAPWLGGESPSLADFELWPWLTLLRMQRPFDDLAQVASYWERVAARPSHRDTNPY